MTDPVPEVDGRHPADVVTGMVDYVLLRAETWPEWDGVPAETPVDGEPPRLYTPHKAIRRVADHLVDHLAELEARLAGRPTEPDRWHASASTTPADLALFTAADLDEAHSRLRRLCASSGRCGCARCPPSSSISRTAAAGPRASSRSTWPTRRSTPTRSGCCPGSQPPGR
jgi:hypothetical protein